MHGDTIFNFNPALALSATNPTINSIFLPSGADGLAVSKNLNASSPAVTFYTVVSGTYYYYNGTSWTNTGDSAGGKNIGGGGGFIYALDPMSGAIYKYAGNGNAVLLTTISPFGGMADVVGDCLGNFYLLTTASPQWLHEYNSSGNLVKSWTMSGTFSSGGAGLAIIGNNVYYGASNIFVGAIGNINISSSLLATVNSSASDYASCPIGGLHHAHTNIHTATYCTGQQAVQVSAIGSGPFSWSVISGPAAITGSGNTISVTSTANSTILLSDTSSCGSYMPEDTVTINVSNPPSITDTNNSPLCSGHSLYVGASTTPPGSSYQWSGPNGFNCQAQDTTILNIPTVDSGYYYVSVALNGCTVSDTVHVVIKPSPAVPIASTNTPICNGDTLKFTVTNSTANVTYNWSGPGNFSSVLQNPHILHASLPDSGEYHVSASANGCSTLDSVFATIYLLPAMPTTSSNCPVCSGNTLLLYANCSTSNVAFDWSGPNGFTANSPGTGIGYALLNDTGYYTVKATLNGCSTKDSIYVNIDPTPAIQIITSNSPLCSGNTLTFSASSNLTSGVTFYWSGPNSFSDSSQSPNINNAQLPDTGTYFVYAKAGPCISGIDSTSVQIASSILPTVSIITNPYPIIVGMNTQFIATVLNGGPSPGYQWRRNGVDIPGYVVNPCNITVMAGDMISVIVHSNAVCAAPDTAVSNALGVPATGISMVQMQDQLKIYPNPASSVLNIESPLKVNVIITDIEGKTVYTNSDGNKQLDITHLKAASYFVKLYDEKGALLKTEKITKTQ